MSSRRSTALRLAIGPALGLAVAILASGASGAPPKITPLSVSSTPSSALLRKGVMVLGVGDSAADATWPIASLVYADAAIRPRIVDRDARVLAGTAPAAGAPDDTKELAELRAKVTGDDAASRAMLKEIARRGSALAVVVVFPATADAPAHARVYDAVDDRLETTAHRAEKGEAPWAPLASTLHGRYGVTLAPAPASSATTPKPTPPTDESKSFLSSPWFWGAVGAAVAGAVIVYAATRDSSSPSAPVRVDWGK